MVPRQPCGSTKKHGQHLVRLEHESAGNSDTSVSTELIVSVADLVIVDGAAVTVLYSVVSWTTVENCVAVSVA